MTIRLIAVWIAVTAIGAAVHWQFFPNGQQSDDDYHYYGMAARFDAPSPIPLLQIHPPDNLTDANDQSRLAVTYGPSIPYPAWAYALSVLTRYSSYETGAFVLFIVQFAVLVLGVMLIACSNGCNPIAASIFALAYLGIESYPTIYLSVPINMAIAVAVLALGLFSANKPVMAAIILVIGVLVHIAFLTLMFYVVGIWLAARWARIGPAVLIPAIIAWIVAYPVIQGFTNPGDPFGVGFGLWRLEWVLFSNHWFIPVLTAAAILAGIANYYSGANQWRWLVAAVVMSIVACLGFVLVDSTQTHHGMHPFGRVLYLIPPVLICLAGCAIAGTRRTIYGNTPLIALLAGFMLIFTVTLHAAGVYVTQVHARQSSLKPLYLRLSQDTALSTAHIVFYRHEYGTVLMAARLYDAKFSWSKIYTPATLSSILLGSSHVVWLESPDDPPADRTGFCNIRTEIIPSGQTDVLLTQANPCQ